MPGWNDECVKEVLGIAHRARPSLLVVDFADNLCLVDEGGSCEPLVVSRDQFSPLLTRLGVRYRRKEATRRRFRRSISRVGFFVGTESMDVDVDPPKEVKGTMLREACPPVPACRH